MVILKNGNEFSTLVPPDLWRHYGCRLVSWIDRNVSDDCYKIRFMKNDDGELAVGYPVRIIFDSSETFIEFKMKSCQMDDFPILLSLTGE